MATYKEKLELLEKCKSSDLAIKCFQQNIDQFRESKLSPGIQRIDDMPHGSRHCTDISDIIVQLESMNENLSSMLVKAINVKNAVLKWINSLGDNRQKAVLMYRYVQGMSISWVADNMCEEPMSDMTVKRITKKAINNLPDPTDFFSNVPECSGVFLNVPDKK